jgi:hypothetical protein
MNGFLIECSFKSYKMAPKFDPMIPRYAILILWLCGIAEDHGPALCGIARDHGPALCGIARDHGPALCGNPALCGIARDQHIFVNFSANSKQN